MNDFFLADDLSGALDAAAAFHRAGRRVRIALDFDAVEQAAPEEVVGITTETRNASPDDAADAVRRALQRGHARGGQLLYKKIDSTLRGPVAAELHALMAALPDARVLFAPANPRVGRTVRRGVLCVHGVPAADTEFGRDPTYPLRQSAIREILGRDADDSRLVVPDTATDADLEAALRQTIAAGGAWVAVGSGALAVPVAQRVAHGPASPPPDVTPQSPATVASPVLMIGGSAHPLNRRQAMALCQTEKISAYEISLAEPLAAANALSATLRQAPGAVLQLPAERATAAAALSAVTTAAAAIVTQAGVRRIFATGGETTFALCRQLGVQTLSFVDEIEPGLSLSIGEARAGSVLLAVKPGGFGDEATWLRAWQRLRDTTRP